MLNLEIYRNTKSVFSVLFVSHIVEVSAFKLYNDLHKPDSLVAPATSTTLEAPKFNSDQILNTTLVTSVGQTVYLHCLVDNIGDRKVSHYLSLTYISTCISFILVVQN